MIIALSGLCYDPQGNKCSAGAGKDTVADLLTRQYGFVKVGFADPMKRFVQEVFDLSDDQVWGSSEHREEPDPRYPIKGEDGTFLNARVLLQTLGTEWGRHHYQDVWVAYLRRIAERLSKGDCYYDQRGGLRTTFSTMGSVGSMVPKKHVVTSDPRFKNEMKYFQDHGGVVVRIKRPLEAVRQDEHQSEVDLLDIPDESFNYVIQGLPRDVPDLIEKAHMMMEYLAPELSPQPQSIPVTLPTGLLEQRQRDVEAGRIMDYDPQQEDIPPFMRSRSK